MHTFPSAPSSSPWETLLARLWQRVRARAPGGEIVREVAEELDHLVQGYFEEAQREIRTQGGNLPPLALCATGGYGRREQHPQSDVDLLFLYEGKHTPWLRTLAEKTLYPLWDLKFSVGHAVRTLEECLQEAEKDRTIKTNLLDLRFLAGDPAWFSRVRSALFKALFYERPRSFVEAKVEELKARRSRYSDTSFLVEPNVKESPGGLRDLHTVLWAGKVVFGIEELADLYRKGVLERALVESLRRGYDYLLFLRTLIHLLEIEQQSRGDRLTLELQEQIAPLLGYTDSHLELATEKFMRDYYEITRGVRRGVDAALTKILRYLKPRSFHAMFSRKRPVAPGFHIYQGELHARLGEFEERPHRIIEAFYLKARYRVPFSYDLARVIEEKAPRLHLMEGEEERYAASWFREIFSQGEEAVGVLSEMNEYKVLGEFLPPFKHIYSRVQRDTYHTYTVDQHLLFCLKHFYELRQKKWEHEESELTALAQSLAQPFTLALGILTHDIGKGYGVDHSQKGAELVKIIARKLFLPPETEESLAFLVRHHLLLTHTMQRRDFSDPKVLRELGALIPDEEHLKMLLLLTYCDLKGVGPEVWNEWKRTLLLKLYDDLRVVLEQGDIVEFHGVVIQENRALLERELARASSPHTHRFLKALPNSFFLRHKGELGTLAFSAFSQVLEQGFGIEVTSGPRGMYWVLMAAPDRPGLLSLLAGILYAGNFSIMEAEGYVLRDEGVALNLFLVVHPDPIFFEIPERKEAFFALAREIYSGRRELPPPPTLPATRPRSRRRVRVQVDDTLSQDYTVVEVFCWDRPGLLYQLSEALFRLGCTIHLARIHTEGQRVSDTFYVQDWEGKKLSLEQRTLVMDELLKIAKTT